MLHSSKMYLLLLLIVTVKSGTTLKCFTCTASNQKNCIASQVEETCSSGMCMTLGYKENEDGRAKSYFIKRCVRGGVAQCRNFCKSALPSDVYRCKVSQCCNTNLCNKIEIPKVVQKRASPASSSNRLVDRYTSLLLCTTLFILSFR